MEEIISPRASFIVCVVPLGWRFIKSGIDTTPSLFSCSETVVDTRDTNWWKSLFRLTKSDARIMLKYDCSANKMDRGVKQSGKPQNLTSFTVYFNNRDDTARRVSVHSNHAFHGNSVRIAGRSGDTLRSQPIHSKLDITVDTFGRQRFLAIHHWSTRLFAEFLHHRSRNLRAHLHTSANSSNQHGRSGSDRHSEHIRSHTLVLGIRKLIPKRCTCVTDHSAVSPKVDNNRHLIRTLHVTKTHTLKNNFLMLF